MPADHSTHLRAFAEVIVRVGLNLQRGQRLLIAEPYELQGVARSAEEIVKAVRTAAIEAGGPHPAGLDIIWGEGPRLREFAAQADWRGFAQLVAANATMMQAAIEQGAALLFLPGSQPLLLEGIAPERITALRRLAWEYFAPIAQQLIGGATNWTAAPAPSSEWANHVYPDLPAETRLTALWEAVFEAMRISGAKDRPSPDRCRLVDEPASYQAWEIHLRSLQNYRNALNAQQLRTLRYQGVGTDLTVTLPPEHRWCTAQLTSRSGRSFVANLPTEEIFTLPHRNSAEGIVRVSRPINYGGAVIDGIDLEFRRGRVVKARAKTNAALLEQLLATDEGSTRLGEVALVPHETSLARSGRNFHHTLLDENASSHIALGDAYAFCLRSPNSHAQNRSLIHVDLPLDARVTLTKTEPA